MMVQNNLVSLFHDDTISHESDNDNLLEPIAGLFPKMIGTVNSTETGHLPRGIRLSTKKWKEHKKKR